LLFRCALEAHQRRFNSLQTSSWIGSANSLSQHPQDSTGCRSINRHINSRAGRRILVQESYQNSKASSGKQPDKRESRETQPLYQSPIALRDPGRVQPRIVRRLAAAESYGFARRAARILKLLGAPSRETLSLMQDHYGCR
jgi:hypothetical protein